MNHIASLPAWHVEPKLSIIQKRRLSKLQSANNFVEQQIRTCKRQTVNLILQNKKIGKLKTQCRQARQSSSKSKKKRISTSYLIDDQQKFSHHLFKYNKYLQLESKLQAYQSTCNLFSKIPFDLYSAPNRKSSKRMSKSKEAVAPPDQNQLKKGIFNLIRRQQKFANKGSIPKKTVFEFLRNHPELLVTFNIKVSEQGLAQVISLRGRNKDISYQNFTLFWADLESKYRIKDL